MNYHDWSNEYFRDAEKIKKTLEKYEKMLREGKSKNKEKLNTTVFAYRNIYYELLNTGRMLRDRANGVMDNATI
ncbi:MAG: hypothetical protein IIU14_00485 [Ruminococcus sp.]|nr:hypothetical protein [Ruminococcus sp.]